MFTHPVCFLGAAGTSTPTLYNTLGLDIAETQYLSLTDSTDFNFNTAYTFCCWVYPTDLSVVNGIYNQRGSSLNFAQMSILPTGKMSFKATYGGTIAIDIESDVTLIENNLYMIGFEVIGSTLSFIINGVHDTNSGSFAVAPTDLAANLQLARVNEGVNFFYFSGAFALPMAFQAALGPQALLDIYNGGTAKQPECYDATTITDLYAFAIPLNDGVDSGQELIDVSGNGNDAFLFGSPTPVYDGEQQGIITCPSGGGPIPVDFNALLLNGTNQLVNTQNDSTLQITGNITLCCWVNTLELNTGIFISKASTTPTLKEAYRLGFESTGKCQMVLSSTGTYSSFTAPTDPSAAVIGEWIHYAGVYNGSTAKVYRNGVEVASSSYSAGIANNTEPVRTGAMSTNTSNHLEGSISSPLIFDTALSPSEIVEIVNLGVGQQPWQISDTIISNCVLALPLNNGVADGREVGDFSGNENNSSLVNVPTYTGEILTFEGNLVYNAFGFDAVDDFITVADDATLDFGAAQDFSISGWFRTSTTSTSSIVNKHNSSGIFEGYSIQFQASGALRAQLTSSGLTATVDSASTDLDNDLWHFFCATYDRSGNLSLYINNEAAVTVSIAAATSIDNTNTLRIGADSAGAGLFLGSLTSIAVYNSLLSASDVAALYNRNLPLDYDSQLTSITDNAVMAFEMTTNDSSLIDLSGNANNGTANGGVTSDGAEIDWEGGGATPPAETFNLLTESGDSLTTESSNNLILE